MFCLQVVTVNDYLARRDSEWVGQVHRFLGLQVGLVQQGLDVRLLSWALQCCLFNRLYIVSAMHDMFDLIEHAFDASSKQIFKSQPRVLHILLGCQATRTKTFWTASVDVQPK